MQNEQLLEKKRLYLARLRALWKTRLSSGKKGIPRLFHGKKMMDMWMAHSSTKLAMFKSLVLAVKDPDMRMDVLNRLDVINKLKGDTTQQSYKCVQLQDQMFRWITGFSYSVPLKSWRITAEDIQCRDFFGLIGLGIHAYERATPERQEAFNKAIMSSVKRRKNAVIRRRQQNETTN